MNSSWTFAVSTNHLNTYNKKQEPVHILAPTGNPPSLRSGTLMSLRIVPVSCCLQNVCGFRTAGTRKSRVILAPTGNPPSLRSGTLMSLRIVPVSCCLQNVCGFRTAGTRKSRVILAPTGNPPSLRSDTLMSLPEVVASPPLTSSMVAA